jgi:hypothetical protein
MGFQLEGTDQGDMFPSTVLLRVEINAASSV